MELADAVWKQLRIRLSEDQREAFDAYYEELVSARRRVSLTSLRGRESIERRHFLESLALLKAIEEAGALSWPAVDIGSGGGFPGLPMKIVRPDMEMTLLEGTEKKATFLRNLVAGLGLNGVRVIQSRAEEVAHDAAEREAYALGLARAVAPLPALVELALPFVRVGGYLAAPKGSAAAREVREAENALRVLGGEILAVRNVDVPPPSRAPTLVLIRKINETPGKYPRRPGIPAKRPL